MSALSSKPSISVVIPTKNGKATIVHCLEGILAQTLAPEVEIIVIDSGSRDGTLELIANYPIRIERIPPDEFNHGSTRNFGNQLARGELVVMTVQDARPVDRFWLEHMVRHFADPKVAGVCGQQVVPHEEDKNPLQWFRPHSQPLLKKLAFGNAKEFEELSPKEKLLACGWDDVNAMYRRSVLLKVPFRSVTFSEDMIWARDALSSGYSLIYDYSSQVYHYHYETFAFRFRRQYTTSYHQYCYFDYLGKPRSLLTTLTRSAYYSGQRKYCPKNRAYWFAYNVQLAMAEWIACWYFWLSIMIGGSSRAERHHNQICSTSPQARLR